MAGTIKRDGSVTNFTLVDRSEQGRATVVAGEISDNRDITVSDEKKTELRGGQEQKNQ